MRRKVILITVAVLVAGSVLAGGIYWYWSNSPRYALQQMALALEARDMKKLYNYVDLKDIFNNFLEASSADLDQSEAQGGDEWSRFTKRMGQKMARLFFPKLFDTFESQIRGLLEKYLSSLSNKQVLAFAAAVTVAQINQQGDEAQVTLVDPKTKDRLRFQMRRNPRSGIWQIVSVNYDDIKRFYKREFQ
jgi:hypothetical protein